MIKTFMLAKLRKELGSNKNSITDATKSVDNRVRHRVIREGAVSINPLTVDVHNHVRWTVDLGRALTTEHQHDIRGQLAS